MDTQPAPRLDSAQWLDLPSDRRPAPDWVYESLVGVSDVDVSEYGAAGVEPETDADDWNSRSNFIAFGWIIERIQRIGVALRTHVELDHSGKIALPFVSVRTATVLPHDMTWPGSRWVSCSIGYLDTEGTFRVALERHGFLCTWQTSTGLRSADDVRASFVAPCERMRAEFSRFLRAMRGMWESEGRTTRWHD